MIWYVDTVNGNNSNSGLSILYPFKDLSPFYYQEGGDGILRHGDTILIKRGSLFNGATQKLYSNESGTDLYEPITVDVYGSGVNPIFTSCKTATPSDITRNGNINIVNLSTLPGLELTERVFGVGNIVINNVCYGNRLNSISALTEDYDFYYDSNTLYIYTSDAITSDVIISCHTDALITCNNNTIYRNLIFQNAGGHAMQTTTDQGYFNIIVENCKFINIGGGYLTGTTRFGNGFEVLATGQDIQVRKCYFENIYDTGVTAQGVNGSFKDIHFDNNLFYKCTFAFEAWISESATGYENCTFNNNIVLHSGYGFGGTDNRGHGFYFNEIPASARSNFDIKNNIMYKPRVSPLLIIKEALNFNPNDNIYILDDNKLINSSLSYTASQFAEYQQATSDKGSIMLNTNPDYADSPMELANIISSLFFAILTHKSDDNTYPQWYNNTNFNTSNLNIIMNHVEIHNRYMVINLRALYTAQVETGGIVATLPNLGKVIDMPTQECGNEQEMQIALNEDDIVIKANTTRAQGALLSINACIGFNLKTA